MTTVSFVVAPSVRQIQAERYPSVLGGDPPIDIPVLAGLASQALTPSGVDWCWQFTEQSPSGGFSRFCVVPNSGSPLDYDALANVDPGTLAVTAAPPTAAWTVGLATKVDKGSLAFNVKDYGATGNGTTDDTAAIQAVINLVAVGTGTPDVAAFLPAGTYRITNTITIQRKSVILRGNGNGNSPQHSTPGYGTRIVWGGVAGVPMFSVSDSQYVLFEDMTIAGHNTNIPSEGVLFVAGAAEGWGTNQQLGLSRVSFGYSLENTTNWMMNYCVRLGGVNANNDQFMFQNCLFSRPVIAGVQIDNTQSIWGLLLNCYWSGNFTAKGLRTNASVQLVNATFDACVTDFDIGFSQPSARVAVVGYYSERSYQPISMPSYNTGFTANGGLVSTAYAQIANGGTSFILDSAQLQADGTISLDSVRFNHASGTRPTIKVRAPNIGATTGGHVYIKNCALLRTDLDLTCASPRSVFVGWDDDHLFTRSEVPSGVTWAPDAQALKAGSAATGSRPSASVAGAGAMFYDTTLVKPIWSNGTVWKDATGTTV